MTSKQVIQFTKFINEQEDKLSILKFKWRELGKQVRSMGQEREKYNIKLRKLILEHLPNNKKITGKTNPSAK